MNPRFGRISIPFGLNSSVDIGVLQHGQIKCSELIDLILNAA
jgi:hypothetical protein